MEASPGLTAAARVVLGLPAYNRPDTLARTIESLLSQTCQQFALVIVEDDPAAGTASVVEPYVRQFPNITCEVNASRLGMIGNWRRVFERGRQLYPRCEYFAWVSDHDLWHARWLEEMVAVLDAHPEAVVAYPHHLQMTADGVRLTGKVKAFDTVGIADRGERIRMSARYMLSGDMIYGLMRADALAAAGVFRRVVTPDRQTLLAMSLFGEFHQVPETLWYREFVRKFDIARQRRSLFAGRVPWYAFVHPHVQHFVTLFWDFALRGAGRPAFGRLAGLRYACAQLWWSVVRDVVRPKSDWRLKLRAFFSGGEHSAQG